MVTQHYLFAHRALPALTHVNKGRVLEILSGEDGQRFLVDVWEQAGKVVEQGEVCGPEGLSHFVKPTGNHGVIAIVHPPAPGEVGEAHLIGIVARYSDPDGPTFAKLSWIRYFTLEHSIDLIDGETRTMLCEWTAVDEHSNYGFGPEPDEDQFEDHILKLLWRTGVRI